MAHQKVTIFNPLARALKYTSRAHDKEPGQIDHTCSLASDSTTTLIVDTPGIYGVGQNKILELQEYNLKIYIYADPYHPQSHLRFCGDIWQNGAKVLSCGKLQASAIPIEQPNVHHQKFTIRDHNGELIDLKKRFGTDKYNVTFYTLKRPDPTANIQHLYTTEKLDDEYAVPAISNAPTWPAILRRPKVNYTDAQKKTDADLQRKPAVKRTISEFFEMHSKKQAFETATNAAQAANPTEEVRLTLL